MENEQYYWDNAVKFHGHVCGGLTIGYKASLYAMELLNVDFSKDEEIVCIAENDACGVDAIQSILGCSIGKGNLILRLRGKQAFSFFNRKNGKSVRIVFKNESDEYSALSKNERQKYIFDKKPSELFDVKSPNFELPHKAKIFQNIVCESCGESAADYFIRIQDGKKVCLDCFEEYKRIC